MRVNLLQLITAGMVSTVFAVMPSTTNYELNDYGFGNGGGPTGTSNYTLEGITGEQSGAEMGTATYSAKTGLLEVQAANVPNAPTLQNPSNWYNKLTVIIDTGGNPSDATFAIAISSDGFATTQYVQSDLTVGPALGIEDYKTYAGWGSGTGGTIIGLLPNTTYSAKVKANRGDFTESGYGPADSLATSDVSLTFDIDIAGSDSESAAPYNLAIGDLLVSTVTTSSDKIWFDLETNADSGGKLFIYGLNTGLRSNSLTYTLTSASADLTGTDEGFGVQSASATQTSGGPFAPISPYDGAGHSVGVIDTAVRQIYSSSAAVVGGRSSLNVKAKASQTTPAAGDYEDILTIIAAASY